MIQASRLLHRVDIMRRMVAVRHFEMLIYVKPHHVRDVLAALLVPGRGFRSYLVGGRATQSFRDIDHHVLQPAVRSSHYALSCNRIGLVKVLAIWFLGHVYRLLVWGRPIQLDRSRDACSRWRRSFN